jgi:anti-sigma regulatory factor (Ser/Thr protein kinase)
MNPEQWSYTHTWAADPTHVSRARAFVSTHLTLHGLTDVVPDAQLVVSELATNAVMHTGTPFTVTVERRDHTVTLQVSDQSPDLPHMAVRSADLQTSGLGLHVVHDISDAWGVTSDPSGGKSVWASFVVVAPDAAPSRAVATGVQVGPRA